MSESFQLRDPLFRLIVRFSNGETIQHMSTDPIDSRAIAPETRYAVISSFSLQNPTVCSDVTVVNLEDVTFIKTERVTLEQLAAEHRIGIRSAGVSAAEDRLPKSLAQLKFI
ncbi:MAG TPA: hypothetical protein VLM38_03600 [Blastocatellia bacterium]|nr:hypothetical protein [Blastocatellia bacterium]